MKTIDQNPKISDDVLFDISTPDADGCFINDPYKVDNVKIYFINRSALDPAINEYDKLTVPSDIQAQYDEAKAIACDDPTTNNLRKLDEISKILQNNTVVNKVYFNSANAVQIFGTDDFPAWLSTDTSNAIIEKIDVDSDGNPLFGKFKLIWSPLGQREGDYFICWTWTPNMSGSSLSSHNYFTLGGDNKVNTVIPSHRTPENKYETLFDRYTPRFTKLMMNDADLSPEVINGLNSVWADFFTSIENTANQLLDIYDANVVTESFLPLLGNTFNLKLKSMDAALWRRQIKKAIPNFKSKGTLRGLKSSFADAGMVLNSFTQLWQVVSQYTYQELFDVVDTDEFILSQPPILPIDINNFELYYREYNSDEWQILNSDYVDISLVGNDYIMTWIGDELSINPISLSERDSIRVVYEIVDVPGPKQSLENYIRTLPLADLRDERLVDYPLKNWNVRVIEETDPLFDAVIPIKQPFKNDVVFGKVRTEMVFSEKVFNSDEFDGSLRDSKEPCDIDKEFVDQCSYCLGSSYNIDVTVDTLSNDRLFEVFQILKENVPFHMQLHSLGVNGSTTDLIKPPVEEIEYLVTYKFLEYVIGGNGANTIFNRVMMPSNFINRDQLATESTVVSSSSGIVKNDSICLFSLDLNLDSVAIFQGSGSFLEVLAPSVNSGQYEISDVNGNYAVVSGGDVVSEPLNESDFTFRLSNFILDNSSTNVEQDNYFTFSDTFGDYTIKTMYDVDNDPSYTGGAWYVEIPDYGFQYPIQNVLSNGRLVLGDVSDSLPSSDTSGISYNLLDDSMNIIATSNSGVLYVRVRGKVEYPISYDIRTVVKLGDYILLAGTQYLISNFASETEFYIENYALGDMAGVPTTIYRRVVDGKAGRFVYKGVTLTTLVDYEASLGINNGANPPSTPLEDDKYKENFLIELNGHFYAIKQIDGTTINLVGFHEDFGTSGVSVNFDIHQYTKTGPITIPARTEPTVRGNTFDFLDRRGNVIVQTEEENVTPMFMASLQNSNGPIENSKQKETISFTVQHKDGRKSKHKL